MERKSRALAEGYLFIFSRVFVKELSELVFGLPKNVCGVPSISSITGSQILDLRIIPIFLFKWNFKIQIACMQFTCTNVFSQISFQVTSRHVNCPKGKVCFNKELFISEQDKHTKYQPDFSWKMTRQLVQLKDTRHGLQIVQDWWLVVLKAVFWGKYRPQNVADSILALLSLQSKYSQSDTRNVKWTFF